MYCDAKGSAVIAPLVAVKIVQWESIFVLELFLVSMSLQFCGRTFQWALPSLHSFALMFCFIAIFFNYIDLRLVAFHPIVLIFLHF